MSNLGKKIISIPAHITSRDWLYAPSTYLVDSFTPFVEEIHLPEAISKLGDITLELKEGESTNHPQSNSIKSKGKYALAEVFGIKHNRIVSPILDLRLQSPENLAHAITNHLPLALCVRRYLKNIGELSPVLILPASLPIHIKKLFIEVGFELLLTDLKVSGKICEFKVSPWISIRGIRHILIKENLDKSDFSKILTNISNGLPKKIFISRRVTRCLSNEKEVEAFLAIRGYQKVYLEDYDILEQIAMVSLADSIVAIHGAALGPLLFRVLFDEHPRIKIVEIFSPGHMTNVFRMVSHQVGGIWVGVRGKLWPAIIKQAYFCLPKNLRKYSLVEFGVCLISLKKAMESIEL